MSDLEQRSAEGPPARPSSTRRWARGVAAAAAGACAIVALAALVLPFAAGPPLLRYVVARMTAPLCGSFHVDGGRLPWDTVPRLLRGRPVGVTLENVRILAADGGEVLAAAALSASVTVHRNPWRATLAETRLAHGRWALASAGGSTPGFIRAWSTVPAGAARDACVARPPPRAPAARSQPPAAPGPPASAAPPPPPLLAIVALRLEAMDVELDFPAWGLRLGAVDTNGTLSIGRSAVVFEANDAHAATGGLLRIGGSRDRWTTRVPFDRVDIKRVAITPDAPADVVLDVTSATTGGARLSGRATFKDVLAVPRTHHARHAPAPPDRTPPPPRPAPGLDLDARWTGADAALAQIDARWLPGWARALTLGVDITTGLRGPFTKLAGEVGARLPGIHLAARLATNGALDVDLDLDDADTAPLTNPALQPLLGGRLSGTLRLRALLAPTLADTVADIREADLRLSRTRRGPFPREFQLSVGQARTRARPHSDDTLAVALAGARLARSTLRLDGIDARWATLRARGAVVADAAGNDVDARFSVDVGSLARLLPSFPVQGVTRFRLGMRGRFDDMTARVQFTAPALITLWSETFVLPATVTASLVSGDILTIDRFTVAHRGGGAVAASGRIVFDGPVRAHADVSGYPLDGVPGLGLVPLPALVAGGTAPASLGETLRGNLDATLDMTGSFDRLALDGQLTVRAARLAGRPLGDGTLRLRARADDIAFQGTLGDTVAFQGTARPPPPPHAGGAGARQGLVGTATVDVRDFHLRPWLPRKWAAAGAAGATAADPRITGRLVATLPPAAAPALRAALRLSDGGTDLQLQGSVDGDRSAAAVRGRVELARLAPAWSTWLAAADGALDIDLTLAEGPASRWAIDRLAGYAIFTRDLSLRPRGKTAELFAPLTIAAGGRIDAAGVHIGSPGLALSAARGHVRADVSGEIVVDPLTPAATRLALSVRGRVDAAALAPAGRAGDATTTATAAWAPTGGSILVSGRVGGNVARPRIDADATVDLAVRVGTPTPARPALALRATGVVSARGDTLSTTGLRVAIGGVGDLTVGSAARPAAVWWTARGNASAPEQGLAVGPLILRSIDAAIAGRNLQVSGDLAPLSIGDLDLAVRLTGRFDGALLLQGDIDVSHAKIDPGRKRVPAPGRAARGPWYRAIPPRLTVDLTLRGAGGGIEVAVPILPDVTADFECRLIATAHGASLSGRLRGDGAYSTAAITLYDWLQPNRIRACQVLPR
ncbi:MAG: hypothetical protein ABUL77_02735 [Bacteroidota bacterium]